MFRAKSSTTSYRAVRLSGFVLVTSDIASDQKLKSRGERSGEYGSQMSVEFLRKSVMDFLKSKFGDNLI